MAFHTINPSSFDPRQLPDSLGDFLIGGITDIDRRCCKLVNGVECGLSYVKEQFAEQARQEIGKKLTEELLFSWLLESRLRDGGSHVDREVPYPTSNQKCDLLILVDGNLSFAVEVKNAWKQWVRCDGSDHTSSNFRGYLLGDASHPGTAHDFDKLERAAWPRPTWLGVLLVGFDTFTSPMDTEVRELERQRNLQGRGWTLASHRAWPDRKNTKYRIACWFWAHPPSERIPISGIPI